jgi:CheY-like chemotaxis protein
MACEVAMREQNLTQAVEQRTAQLAESIQEAETARAKAEAANRTKSLFLSNMSHELRTPLNVILGFTQLMMRSSSVNSQLQGYLDTIIRSGEHLLTLINDVLSMSQIEAGRITLKANDFHLAAFLDWLKQIFQFKAESKGIQLIFELAPNLPQSIHTDESKLRQVLVNLLSNALKFTTNGSIILRVSVVKNQEVTTDDDGKLTLNFEVADTGMGISPQELTNLFQPFIQTETGRNSQEGTGLGLAISRSFVRLMGGEMTVESQVGVGTTFKFNIQTYAVITEQIEQTAPSRQVVGLLAGQPTYRILIVEDKPENQQLMMELLTPVGFDVRCAINGQDAINIWQSWSPHLIWMDMRMPVLNGYEATKQIKAIGNPATIVIALSGSAFEEDKMTALSVGCDDFVRKPFRTEVIFSKIALHLGVGYIYAEDSRSSHRESLMTAPVDSLTPQDIAVMPSEWVAQLHDFALKVNAKQIMQLITQIPEQNAYLAMALTSLVNNFEFEKIVELSKT